MERMQSLKDFYEEIYDAKFPDYDQRTPDSIERAEFMIFLLQEAGIPLGFHFQNNHGLLRCDEFIYYTESGYFNGEASKKEKEAISRVKNLVRTRAGFVENKWKRCLAKMMFLYKDHKGEDLSDEELARLLRKNGFRDDDKQNLYAIKLVRRFYGTETVKDVADIFNENGFYANLNPKDFDNVFDHLMMAEIRDMVWKIYKMTDGEVKENA